MTNFSYALLVIKTQSFTNLGMRNNLRSLTKTEAMLVTYSFACRTFKYLVNLLAVKVCIRNESASATPSSTLTQGFYCIHVQFVKKLNIPVDKLADH